MTDTEYKLACRNVHLDLKKVIDGYIERFGDPWTFNEAEFKKKRHIIQNLNEFLTIVKNKAGA